ncbi:hypothetical protein KA005_36940 [bacterium]|nr:hypothetical protein [bacterium]
MATNRQDFDSIRAQDGFDILPAPVLTCTEDAGTGIGNEAQPRRAGIAEQA